MRYTYDLAGRETSVRPYARAPEPCACRRGYAKKTVAYNTLGNVTEEAYYDTEENLTDTSMGYAIAAYTYDELGNLTSERYYDAKSSGVMPTDARYAYALMDYDDDGRLLSEEYFDEMDKPVNNREGFAAHFLSYAESGLIAEEYYLDAGGDAAALGLGYSRRVLVSENDDGSYVMRVIEEAGEEGGSYALLTYDRYDRVTESRYFDAAGNAIDGPEGCAWVAREYTSRGQVSLLRYFDGEGRGTAVNGVWGVKREFNAFGNLAKETWLDAEGEPVLNDDGYAGTVYDYDLSNSASVERYYQRYVDTEGEPIAAKNGAWGLTMLYYPTTRVRVVTFIGADGEPIVTEDGYAILEYEEDENGNRVWEGYYDAIHAQINCAAGYSSVERGYDSMGRLISERYLDRYNKLTNNVEGVAGWNGYYNGEGELVVTSRYDQDRKSVKTDD